jgi:hypothetical protein
MLMQVLQLIWIVAASVVLVYALRENRRLRTQNEEMQQLVADAAAQATLDSEASADLLGHLQAMRAENAALKARQ